MCRRVALIFFFIAIVVVVSGVPVAWAKSKSAPKATPAAAKKAPSRDPDTTPSDDIIYESKGDAVLFSHKAHVDGFGLECDSCHSKIFEVKAHSGQDKGDFTMQTFEARKYCGACHDGSKVFSVGDFEQCSRCHVGKSKVVVTGKQVKGPKAAIELGSGDSIAVFKHTLHESFSCNDCHTKLFPMKNTGTITTMDDINNRKACGSCHNGETAFDTSDCTKCHPKM